MSSVKSAAAAGNSSWMAIFADSGAYALSQACAAATRSSQDRDLQLGQLGALLRLHPGRHIDTRDLDEQSEMRECRAEQRRGGLDVCVWVQQRVPERGLVAGRELALHLTTGRRGGELVELVEQARHRVGPVRVELDRLVGPWPQEQESELFRRDDLGDRVGSSPLSLGGRHLLAADVEELVRNVERWLALEHLAGDGVAPVARSAGGREVLAPRFDGHAEERPLRRPFEVPGQLRVPAERADPAGRATAARPGHEVGAAFEEDLVAVPVGHDRGPDLAARRADDADRVPRLRVLDVGDATVDLAHQGRPVESQPDVRIHLRPSGRCRSSSSSDPAGCQARRRRR